MVQLLPAGYPNQAVLSAAGAPSQGQWAQYEWIFVCGCLAAFFMAWGIGANDVANAFATSVGSKTLKLWQAVIIAGVFEFLGAMVLGGEVAKTIATDIVRTEVFNNEPEVYMYGMLCALTAASIWLLVATYACLAVSTTHSIIGAILGFGLIFAGSNGIKWNDCKPDFPWSSGFLPVVLSWFVAPIMAGILSTIIFNCVRFGILRRKNSTNLSFYVLPILIFITFFINLMFVLGKGAKKDMEKRWPPKTAYSTHCSKKDNGPGKPKGNSYKDYSDLYNAAAWIAAVVGVGLGALGGLIGIPLMKRRYAKDLEEEKRIEEGGKEVEEYNPSTNLVNPTLERSPNIAYQIWFIIKFLGLRLKTQLIRGLHFDVHQNVAKDATVSSIHEAAEVFDPHTEQVFKYLQVFSACCVSFGHGANDVANAIGPLAGIWFVYNNWQLPGKDATAEKWLFVLGGIGLVVGLMTYGYNIIMELGVTLLKLTPSRGFSAELATGLTISLASFYGLPISTTQTIVGAETGVGLSENIKTGINFPVLIKTWCGWVATIFIAGLTCAAIFSMGVYSPSIQCNDDIITYRYGIANATKDLVDAMNTTNNGAMDVLVKPVGVYWKNMTGPGITAVQNVTLTGNKLNGTGMLAALNKLSTSYKVATDIKKDSKLHFYVDPEYSVYFLRNAISLYRNYSVLTIGQNFTAVKIADPTLPVGGADWVTITPKK